MDIHVLRKCIIIVWSLNAWISICVRVQQQTFQLLSGFKRDGLFVASRFKHGGSLFVRVQT